MPLGVLQLVLSLCAGVVVFLLWRRVTRAGKAVFWLVTAGFLIRAIGGQIAFWISYLNLPIARSLQVGNGLWIFAVDAIGYFGRAAAAADHGLLPILLMSRTEISVFYAQALATSLLLFGAVTSTAILLNLICYLGCCAMALKLTDDPDHAATKLAIAAISLSPSAILWAVQPLKDTLFLFLVAALFAVARLWQKLWRDAGARRIAFRVSGATLLLIAIVYAISAVRWYFGIVVVIAMVPFVILTIIQSPRRVAPAAVSVALLLLCAAAFFAGAGPYTPPALRHAVFGNEIKEKTEIPDVLIKAVNDQRKAFDTSAGATMIGAGEAVQKIDSTLGVESNRVAAVHQPGMVAPRSGPPPIATKAPVAANAPAPEPAAASGAPSVPQEGEGDDEQGTVVVPASPLSRFLTGAAAVILPRFIAQSMGLLNVGGGRGMWLLIEVDTLVFDVFLVLAVVAIVRGVQRRALGIPVFWLMLIVAGTIGAALAYTVSNFGTLFRHRDMILLMLALLPLAIADRVRQRKAAVERIADAEWSSKRTTAAGA